MKIMMQMKNKTLAMVFDVLATPVKPNIPATTDIIKNIIAHFNITIPLLNLNFIAYLNRILGNSLIFIAFSNQPPQYK
jgi:hypothetical protein